LTTTISNVSINLRSVRKSDHIFLYELLKQRNLNENISHKKMTTFSRHVKFVMSKPYSKWYIIEYEKKKVGSIYLTQTNEIGIHIIKAIRRKNIATLALKILMKEHPKQRYLANINPKNQKSIKFFTKQKFNLIQYTYELIPSDD